MDPERLRKGTPAGDASLSAGIWVETQSQVTSPHCAAKAIFPAVWRWSWSCWNSHWIFSAYPGSHGRIIPKAFQELDPGSVHSQLMLALQIGICPNRSEAGHELPFILAIVCCFLAVASVLTRAHVRPLRVSRSLRVTASTRA